MRAETSDDRAARGRASLKQAQYVGQEIRHGKIMRKVVLPDATDPAPKAGGYGRSGQKAKDPEQLEGRAKRREGCFAHLCPTCMAPAGEPCRNQKRQIVRAHAKRREVGRDMPFGGGRP